ARSWRRVYHPPNERCETLSGASALARIARQSGKSLLARLGRFHCIYSIAFASVGIQNLGPIITDKPSLIDSRLILTTTLGFPLIATEKNFASVLNGSGALSGVSSSASFFPCIVTVIPRGHGGGFS